MKTLILCTLLFNTFAHAGDRPSLAAVRKAVADSFDIYGKLHPPKTKEQALREIEIRAQNLKSQSPPSQRRQEIIAFNKERLKKLNELKKEYRETESDYVPEEVPKRLNRFDFTEMKLGSVGAVAAEIKIVKVVGPDSFLGEYPEDVYTDFVGDRTFSSGADEARAVQRSILSSKTVYKGPVLFRGIDTQGFVSDTKRDFEFDAIVTGQQQSITVIEAFDPHNLVEWK